MAQSRGGHSESNDGLRVDCGDLSLQARSLWAKTGGGDESHLWSPLYVHLLDSFNVAGLLWDEWLSESTRTYLAQSLGADEIIARTLLCWLAGVHDIGKATPSFQCKVPQRAEPVMSSGLHVPRRELAKPFAHAFMGEVILRRWLQETRGWAAADARDRHLVAAVEYASVVGAHHGSTPSTSNKDLSDIERHSNISPNEALGDTAWQAVQHELLAFVFSVGHVEACEDALMHARLPTTTLVLLNGLVIMADWIASNVSLFPLVAGISSIAMSRRRARKGWESLALPGPWQPLSLVGLSDEELFHSRFGTLPRSAHLLDAQKVTVQAARSMEEPGLLIVEAPMGSGKTEASLLGAEVLASRFGEGGVIYLLPTMATSNAMFARVEHWLEAVPDARGATRRSMQLLHSKAELNSDFARLQTWNATWMGDDSGTGEGLVAHQWFGGRKRGMLASFVVGTVDQLLMAALKVRHVQLRQLGLAGKVVIIDEVHAYDAYMSVYLDRVLDYLGAYGVPVILLSATLPPSRREELIRAYRGEDGDASSAQPLATSREVARRGRMRSSKRAEVPPPPRDGHGNPSYPLITVSSRDRNQAPRYLACPPSDRQKRVQISFIDEGDDALLALLKELLADGGCACVLRDTVGRAQETYDLLRGSFGNDVLLVHSRFLAIDRAANDARLLRLLGPDAADRPKRLIVVGTQVIEQSLDIDFDVMVSDIAPIDLLLQRMGRLHRHERGICQASRPTRLLQARCFITGCVDWSSEPPEMERGIVSVYEKALLWRSILAIEERMADGVATICLPLDIAPLVEEVYESKAKAPEGWRAALGEADKELLEHQLEKKKDAETWLLGKPQNSRRCRGLDSWLDASAIKSDERARVAVRDTQDSIEVVVVQRIKGYLYTFPGIEHDESGRPLPQRSLGTGIDIPDDEAARLAALCTVNLPPRLNQSWIAADVIDVLERSGRFDGWQESRWLRGVLPLVLDEKCEAVLSVTEKSYILRYTHDRGLELDMYDPKEEEA